MPEETEDEVGPDVPPRDWKKGARYSKDHKRYSFDVDVKGPMIKSIIITDPPPELKDIGIQAMIISDDFRSSGSGGSGGQRIGSYGSSHYRASEDGERSISYTSNLEDRGGGDASSSEPDEWGEDESGPPTGKTKWKSKQLENKDSRRRDAATTCKPRGYKDLDLKEPMPIPSFDQEEQATEHELDKEESRQRGIPTPLSRQNVLWPACSEFDLQKVSKKIEELLKRCWTLDEKWQYIIKPMEAHEDNFRKRIVFEVKFSQPSPETPVPPATASVFFTYEIPFYTVEHDCVLVSYVLEGNRHAYKPGVVTFQEKWLYAIIANKLRVQEAINF